MPLAACISNKTLSTGADSHRKKPPQTNQESKDGSKEDHLLLKKKNVLNRGTYEAQRWPANGVTNRADAEGQRFLWCGVKGGTVAEE